MEKFNAFKRVICEICFKRVVGKFCFRRELFVDDSEEKLFVDLRYCLSQFNLRMHCAKILNGQQS